MNKIQQLIQKYNQEREVLNQLNILTNIREELENLINKAKANNTILLTTEKDYLRIDDNYKKNINFLKIAVEIENRNQFIEEIKKVI